MYYEINIAKQSKLGRIERPDYRHFFATAERSITTESELKAVLLYLVPAFPMPEFNITVTKWEKLGEQVNIEDILK